MRFILLACGLLLASCAPDAPPPRYSAAQFFDTERVFGASFSADGSRILMTSDRSGVMNVLAQPVDGGASEVLTESSGDAFIAVSFFPDDDRVLYTADQGGNELNHLYALAPGGEARDLTPGENLKAGFAGFTADGERFFLTSNERDAAAFDLYEVDAASLERRLAYRNPGGYSPGPVSPDGRWWALSRSRTNADSDVWLADLASPDTGPVHLTEHEGDAEHIPFAFTPNGAALAYGTDAHGEFRQVWTVDLDTGSHAPLIEAEWDVMYAGWSRNGRYRFHAVNADAVTEVMVLDTATGLELDFPEVSGDVTGVAFSGDEAQMAFYVNADTAPANLHVWDLESGEHRQLTDSLSPGVDPERLVGGEVVRYPSFDGLDIPAILFRPQEASPATPVPALVWVHGGPGGQSRKGYRAEVQHLVNHGYAVFMVNNRGSSGYGKTFFHLDDQRHGDVDLKDCVWGRRYLETLDWVDGDRVGIIGGSYGGYMVAAALAFEPEAFDVGVNIFGVTNWVRTLSEIPAWWGPSRDALYEELGDPETDMERLSAISPLFHAGNIVKPLYVVQGANDPRVQQVESDELVEAVRAGGAPVEYVLFPDEGHGFRHRKNRIENADRIVEFLEAYLR